MKLRHLGMILWVCLKCMKLLVMPWFYNFKLYWEILVWFTMWLLLWKMNTSTLKLWLEHCDLLLVVNLWSFFVFMEVFALGMCYFKSTLICDKWWQGLCGFKFGNCIISEMSHWKLKTPIKTRFVNKVITFEETLEFKQIILLCYGRQNRLILQ